MCQPRHFFVNYKLSCTKRHFSDGWRGDYAILSTLQSCQKCWRYGWRKELWPRFYSDSSFPKLCLQRMIYSGSMLEHLSCSWVSYSWNDCGTVSVIWAGVSTWVACWKCYFQGFYCKFQFNECWIVYHVCNSTGEFEFASESIFWQWYANSPRTAVWGGHSGMWGWFSKSSNQRDSNHILRHIQLNFQWHRIWLSIRLLCSQILFQYVMHPAGLEGREKKRLKGRSMTCWLKTFSSQLIPTGRVLLCWSRKRMVFGASGLSLFECCNTAGCLPSPQN